MRKLIVAGLDGRNKTFDCKASRAVLGETAPKEPGMLDQIPLPATVLEHSRVPKRKRGGKDSEKMKKARRDKERRAAAAAVRTQAGEV